MKIQKAMINLRIGVMPRGCPKNRRGSRRKLLRRAGAAHGSIFLGEALLPSAEAQELASPGASGNLIDRLICHEFPF
jgi:hypothetical protein